MRGGTQWLSRSKAKGACAKRVEGLLEKLPEQTPAEGVQPLNAGFFKLESFRARSPVKGKT